MNPVVVAGLLAALLALPWQTPPLNLPPSSGVDLNTERVESGRLQSADGETLSYRIRLLPLASFPDLPPAVVTELSRRHCMIPQSFEAEQPENVIRGAFRAAATSDWAALCSAAGTTTLYVFFAGEFDTPIALRSQRDTAWLAAEPGSSVSGSAWGIAVRPAAELHAVSRLHHPVVLSQLVIDHDAIDDARLERSLTIHYYQAGKWLSLDGGE